MDGSIQTVNKTYYELATFELDKTIWNIIAYAENIKRWSPNVNIRLALNFDNDRYNLCSNASMLKLAKPKTNTMKRSVSYIMELKLELFASWTKKILQSMTMNSKPI